MGDGYIENLLQVIQLFLIYAFLGWCCEAIFTASTNGRFIDQGFLNEVSYCLLYGSGVLAVRLILESVLNKLGLLFIGAVILTSTIEWVVHTIIYGMVQYIPRVLGAEVIAGLRRNTSAAKTRVFYNGKDMTYVEKCRFYAMIKIRKHDSGDNYG